MEDFELSEIEEGQKRRRELLSIIGLGLVFLILTWVEYQLFGLSKELPFVHSIFFFGLVNFNISLLLLLLFLVFRNVIKAFSEKEGRWTKSLKSKLIASFVTFSVVPTILMFFVSVFYINHSFDKWFSIKTAEVLKNSLEVTNAYYLQAKKKNYHFAGQVVKELEKSDSIKEMSLILQAKQKAFSLDAVEFYPELLGKRILVTSEADSIYDVPAVPLDFLKKGIIEGNEASTIHHFEDGNLVRVIKPITWKGKKSALVVSTYIPLSLISRMDDIAAAYEELKDQDPIQYPIKSIYLIILVLMTLVILLCATWLGFYLARQLSIPLEKLSRATRKISKREYDNVEISSGSEEINELVGNFNMMITNLAKSEREVLDAHRNLKVILTEVNTAVVAIDQIGMITTVNRHAGQLLEINPNQFIGRQVKDVLNKNYYGQFKETIEMMKKHSATTLQKEIQIGVTGRQLPIQLSITLLHDENQNDLGLVLVFDDLTMVVNAQRAAAWKEVARRIAHEIKNPLTPIKLAAQRLQKKFGSELSDPAFSDCTKMIIREADGLKDLVNEFNQFARLPQIRSVRASLNHMLDTVLVLYRTAHKDILIELETDSGLPEFLFDPDQMKRAIVNLLENAVVALNGSSAPKIKIVTRYDKLAKIVRVIVEDNGCGIPETLMTRVFEPYLSTKANGTGLGLAIVKKIIEDHNGFVRALSVKPKGIRMVIELPVSFSKKFEQLTQPDGGLSQEVPTNVG